MWLPTIRAATAAAALAAVLAPINVLASPVESAESIYKRQATQPFNSDYTGPQWTSPPSYPSPWGAGHGDWGPAYEKARAFVSQLTLLEKVNLTTGVGWEGERCVGNVGTIPRLGFPSLCMQDSPLGVRNADYVSGFPAGLNVAATWSRTLARARGEAMGAEHRGKGVDVQLGPVCGPLGRSPEGGRNWEGFSPDPYLTGALIAPTVQGIQSQGVIACTKHYLGNEQEHFRQVGESKSNGYNITKSISANIDDKTIHELYLWPFADAVRAGTGSVMCSYNQINNSYGCANSYTLNHLLKDELDFQGFIMSDWQAQHSGVGTALAGLDMTMPGDTDFLSGLTFWGTNLTIAVINGTIPEWRVDDMATRIMAAYYYVGRDTHYTPTNFYAWSYDTYDKIHQADPASPTGLVNEHVNVQDEHRDVIRQVAQASNVLLKNTGGLPLSGKEKQVGIIGYDAGSNPWGANGCPNRGCNNGTLAMGYGSGTADFPYLVTPEQAIQQYVVTQTDGEVYAILDNYADTQIQTLATQADVSIVFANADAGEGFLSIDGNVGDRNNLSLWEGADRLINNVTKYSSNVIVVLHTVGAVNVSAWYDNENVTGIIWAGLPGQESGNAIVDALYGFINPGGKLPFTIARNREDFGTDLLYEPNNGQFDAPQDLFSEGVFIDYRYLDANGIEPIYEFGFGLSYTTFEYSNLVITPANPAPYTPTSGQTGPAPVLGNASTDPSAYLFPNDTIPYRPYLYIYPYLNSTDLRASADDPDYGLPADQYVPPGATDGSPQPLLAAGGAPGGNPGLYEVVATVTATITNTGSIEGDEVVQIYVSLGEGEPPKVLRGFDRLTIAPGAAATFTAELTRRDVSVWDTTVQNWVEVSNPTIFVGASSRNLPLSGTLSGNGGGGSPSPPSGPSGGFSAHSWSGIYGHPTPTVWPPVSQITDGQPQAPTGGPLTQISDGQPQAPTGGPVGQLSDGQPQATTA
ncbi:beta-glucosidase [Capronia coronata CBS 617.96]|uniref:beta-glucosidase n=1 Tax=Capronia coronata CBS 617.96 TaxID=1182541 RepID=W9Y8K7_9EURO|nr:beta-glucosidase [Capronia coronata CBS 617.96]EXJ85576.1 beta-glucosidase [Capronia coronata CBS 617.96]